MKIQNITPSPLHTNYSNYSNCKRNSLSFQSNIYNNDFVYPTNFQSSPYDDIRNFVVTLYDNSRFKGGSFQNYLHQKGKVTKEDFRKLTPEKQIEYIQKASAYVEKHFIKDYDAPPRLSARCAQALKNSLDKKYEDGYRIISLGTSPVPITQAMEYLGCEVIYLPISDVRHHIEADDDPEEIFDTYPNMGTAMRYLEHKGFDDKKVNIITDYCITGNSLEVMTNCIKSYFDLKDEDFAPMNIIEALKETQEESNLTNDEIRCMKKMMYLQVSEWISNVVHFSIIDSNNFYNRNSVRRANRKEELIFKKFDDFSKPLARAYSICLLNEAQKLG